MAIELPKAGEFPRFLDGMVKGEFSVKEVMDRQGEEIRLPEGPVIVNKNDWEHIEEAYEILLNGELIGAYLICCNSSGGKTAEQGIYYRGRIPGYVNQAIVNAQQRGYCENTPNDYVSLDFLIQPNEQFRGDLHDTIPFP